MKAYRPFFYRAIKQTYPQESLLVIKELETHYKTISADTAFALTSANPIDRRLDFSAYFLALIHTLDARGASFEFIRKICLEVVTAYVQPTGRVEAWFKRLLPKLVTSWVGKRMVGKFAKKVRQRGHPDGFVAEIITDKEATYGLGYGVDILECGICKLFHKHNAFKYASILCEVDEITTGLAGLELIRSGTIGNGAHKCDFRYKRKG
jgi:L-2-amino-thiazoline-4-carboxylic acid hydrolase